MTEEGVTLKLLASLRWAGGVGECVVVGGATASLYLSVLPPTVSHHTGWAIPAPFELRTHHALWNRNENFTCDLPRNASTCPAIPLIAFRKMRGSAWRQGCWHGSITPSVLMANWRNFCVWLITSGFVKLTGFPMVFKNLYQLCAMQSFVIPCGIKSSSPVHSFCSLNWRRLVFYLQ